MKKLLFVLLSAFFCLSAIANDNEKKWRFENNEDGECVIDVTIPTSKDQASAIKAVKTSINKITLSARNLITSTDSTLVYHLSKNTKMRYNPFAGNFTEDMSMNLIVLYSNGNIYLNFTEPTVICTYSGYGAKTTSKAFSARIEEFYTCQEKVNDSSVKNKEKKECKEEIKNINGELNKCQEEIDNMIETIKKGL